MRVNVEQIPEFYSQINVNLDIKQTFNKVNRVQNQMYEIRFKQNIYMCLVYPNTRAKRNEKE